MKPHNPPLAAGGLPYPTYQKIRAYCWQDLAAYLDTPARNSVLELSVKLAGSQMGEIKHEQDCAMDLYRCRDLSPRENSAAHLLAVISNHRAITWQREPHPPAGREPAPPLEQWQAEKIARQTREAVEQYAAYLPEREAVALLAVCVSAIVATPTESATDNRPKWEIPERWEYRARQIGEQWMKAQKKRPGVKAIAEFVEGELSTKKIVGARGKLLDAETIKREALTGITERPPNGKRAKK